MRWDTDCPTDCALIRSRPRNCLRARLARPRNRGTVKMRRAILMLCVLFAAVAACGQGSSATGSQAPASQGGQPQATLSQSAVDTGGSGTAVSHLEVQGGPQAGIYDATGSKSDCNIS